MENTITMELEEVEVAMFLGLNARDRELKRDISQLLLELQRDYDKFRYVLEERLGLDHGSIGTTHGIDTQTMTVVALASE